MRNQGTLQQLEKIRGMMRQTRFINPLDQIALAWLMENDICAPTTPCIALCKCVPIDKAIPMLERVLTTPNGNTTRFLPGMDLDLGVYSSHLPNEQKGYWAAVYQKYLHTKEANCNNELEIFSDLARDFPQYSNDWYQKIRRLWGIGINDCSERFPLFSRILAKTDEAAQAPYTAKHGCEGSPAEMIQVGLAFAHLLARTAPEGTTPMDNDLDSLRTTAAYYCQRLNPYRSAAYSARGLVYEDDPSIC